MTFEEFIVNKDGSFLISRKIKGKSYEFGVYPTLEEAQKECERLDDNGWPIRINKPKYQDFYNPPKIDSKEIKNLEKFNNLILLKISVKLNKSINKWYVELVYHSNIFKIGLFINQIETEAFINKFLINGSVTKETILTILDYESIDDFKKESKLEVLYDINEDKYNLQLINKDQILTLGSYFAENQAKNVKKDYLEYLNKISCFKKIDKERFIHFADENISYYNNLEIGQINEIISDGYKLPLNFQELIDLIDDFKNSHLTVLQLSEKYKIPGSVIKKIIYNEESGKFEGVLKEYNEKLESLDFDEFATDLINIGNDEDSYNKNTNLSNDAGKSYTNLSLKNNGKVFAGNNPLKIKVYEIEDLYDSFKKGSSIKNLSKHYDIEEYLIKKIIHTYQNGDFDNVINEWNNEFKSDESIYSQNPFEDSIRSRLEISDESSNQPYKSLRVNKYGNLEAENRNLGFTIFDARNIHEDYNAGEEIKDIIKKHNFTENKINRIILRYDAGDFHKVLKKMLRKNPSNEHTAIKIKNNIPFTNLETDTNGNILIHSSNSNQNISLGLKIKDIILLFNEYKKNRSIKSLSNHFNMGYASTERIINRIITGDFKEIIKLNPNLKLNEEKNNSQSTKSKDKHVESPEKNNSSNNFADEVTEYVSDLSLKNNEKISSGSYTLPLKIYEIEELYSSFKKGITVEKLSKQFNVSEYIIKKTIYNYELGKFNEVITEWKHEKIPVEPVKIKNGFNDPIRERIILSKSNNVPYKILKVSTQGILKGTRNELKFTILDAREIHESYNEGQSIENLAIKYKFSNLTILRIIGRYDAGDFDKFLKEMLIKNPSIKDTNLRITNNTPFDLGMDAEENIYNIESIMKYNPLGLKLKDTKLIFEEYKNNRSIKSLSNHFNMNYDAMERIINRFIAGDFKKIISLNYKSINLNTNFTDKLDEPVENDGFKDSIRERVYLTKSADVPYQIFKVLDNGHLKGKYKELNFTILEARTIHESYNEGQQIDDLTSMWHFSDTTIKRIIGRYDAGDFDKFLKEVLIKNPLNKFTNLRIKNNTPFDLGMDAEENIYNIEYDGTHNRIGLKLNDIKLISDEYKNNRSIKSLSIHFNMDYDAMENIINRFIAGDFKKIMSLNYNSINLDNILNNKLNKTDENDNFEDSIRKRVHLSKSNNIPYKILKVSSYGSLKRQHSRLKFTILDARDIHESYNEGQKIDDLASMWHFSNTTIRHIIGRYDAGDFDKFLKEVLIKNPSNKNTNLRIKNNTPFNPKIDAEGNIYHIESNGTNNLIGLNLKDIKLISKEYGNNRSIKSLSNHLNMNYDVMERIINRIIVGDFKKIPQIKKESFNKISNLNEDVDSSKVKEKTGKLNEINEKIDFILNYYDNILEESKNSEITKKSKSEELNKKTGKLNNQKDIEPNLSNETIHKSIKPVIIKDEKPAETPVLNNNEESEVTFNNFKEINELKDQIEKLNKSNKEKTDVIDHLILENQQNSGVYAQKIKDLNNSLEDFDHLTIKVNMLEEENLNLKTNNTEKSHKIERLIKEKNEYLLKRTNTNNDLNDSLAKYNQLNSEVKDLKSEISNLKDVNVEKSNQIDDLVIKNKKSSEEYYQKISNLNDSLAEYGHIKSENEDLKQVIKTKSEELKKLVETNKKSEQTYTQKIEDLKSSIVNQEQINDLKSEINILKSENANLKTFNKNKSQELELEKSKIKKINNKLQNIEKEYNNKIYDLKDFSNELLTENEKLKFELQSKPKDKLNSEIESLKLKIKDMENVYNRNIELNNEIYDLKKGQASLINYNNEDNLNHLKGQISKANLELNSLKKSNKELLSENMKLKSVLKSKPEDELKSEIESLKLQIKNMKTVYNENKKLNKEIKELKKGKNSLKGYNTIEHSNNNSYENLKDQLSKAKTELTELNKGSNQLNKDIKKLNNEKKILQDEKDKIIQSYNEENNLLKDTLSINKSKLQDLQKSNQQLIDENEKLKSVNNVEGQNKNNFESKNNTKNDKKNLSKDLEKVDDFIYKFINGKIEKIKKH